MKTEIIKKTIIALIITVGITGSILMSVPEPQEDMVYIDVKNIGIIEYTKADYATLTDNLFIKYDKKEVFTLEEYYILIAILNKRTKEEKTKDLKDINKANLINKMMYEK